MTSASHNPVEWNALKFIAPSGLFLDSAEGLEMRAAIEKGIRRASWAELGTVEQDDRAVSRHLERVLSIPYIDVPGIRRGKFKVALDCVRGAGSVIVPQLLERLGCTVNAIHLEPDGRFPRSPEPTTDNLEELEQLVLRTGSAVGLAVDPDVDRLALVSNEGKAIGEDYTLALAARLCPRHRKGPLWTNRPPADCCRTLAKEAGVPAQPPPAAHDNSPPTLPHIHLPTAR